MRKMYSENQVKRKALEALNVEVVDNENYSLEFNDPMKFNEPIYDKNGNEISGGSGSGTTLYKHIIECTGLFDDEDTFYQINLVLLLPFENQVNDSYIENVLLGRENAIITSSDIIVNNNEARGFLLNGYRGAMVVYNTYGGEILLYDLTSIGDVSDTVSVYE